MTAGRDAARRPVHRIRLTGQLVRPKLLTSENAVTELLLSAQYPQQDLEHGIDGRPRRVVRIRPQMRVGIEGLSSGGVPQPGLHRLDRLAVADEQGSVEVPQFVHPGPLGDCFDGGHYWAPDEPGEPWPQQRTPVVIDEQQPLWAGTEQP